MDRNRDLLPWILCGLSLATAAIAIGVNSIKSSLLSTPAAAVLSAPVLSAPAESPAAAALPAAPEFVPPPAAEPQVIVGTQEQPAQEQFAQEQAAPSSQIWVCTANGTKTYSSNPCGENSSLVEVGPVNTMEATRVYPPLHAYAREPHYQPEYPVEDAPEQAVEEYPSYGVVGVAPYYARKRPWHPHAAQHSDSPPQHSDNPPQHSDNPPQHTVNPPQRNALPSPHNRAPQQRKY